MNPEMPKGKSADFRGQFSPHTPEQQKQLEKAWERLNRPIRPVPRRWDLIALLAWFLFGLDFAMSIHTQLKAPLSVRLVAGVAGLLFTLAVAIYASKKAINK